VGDVTSYQVMRGLEQVAEDGLRAAREALAALAKMRTEHSGDGGEAVADLEYRLRRADGELGERLLAGVEAGTRGGWVQTALEVADDALAELGTAELSVLSDAPEERPSYWVGRLEGTLRGLVLAVRGELL
jgi:hypothetical protein